MGKGVVNKHSKYSERDAGQLDQAPWWLGHPLLLVPDTLRNEQQLRVGTCSRGPAPGSLDTTL